MKRTLTRLTSLIVVMLVLHSIAAAQTGNKSVPPDKPKTTVQTQATSTTDEMREQQLRVFREHVLARALDNVKRMEEPGLRLSARIEILSYFASDKARSDEKRTLATQIARDALLDLREHHEEIDSFMVGYLSNNLGSWIQKYRPNLLEEFEKTAKETVKANSSQRIRSLFALENGDVLAAKRIRQELEEHGSLDGLYFWLDELMVRNSKQFEPVASDVVTRAAQGQITFETLFWISDIYLRAQVSNALRNRFITTVVARTQPANFIAEPPPQSAHDLLTKLLPVIKQSIPELFDQAQNQSFAIRATLNERQLSSDARVKRLKESVDPIGDLKSEAQSAKTKAERNELLLQAAELALEKKKFALCLDIVDEFDVNVAPADPNWQRTIDQLLRNLVKACLTDNVTNLAEKATAQIASNLSKTESLILIMRYYTKANDKESAEKLLIEATKVAATGPDTPDKAKAFFGLSVACDHVDGTKKADLLLSGIKVMNSLSKPDTNARDKTAYQIYVLRLDNAGRELTRGFKGLTRQDENSAMALVEKLQKHDLRTFALLGILLGVDGLLTQPAV